jgi:hypothetical protein
MPSSHLIFHFISTKYIQNLVEMFIVWSSMKVIHFYLFKNSRWLAMSKHVPNRVFSVFSSLDPKGHVSFCYHLMFVVINLKKILSSETTGSIWIKVGLNHP